MPDKGDPRGYYRALGVPRTASAEQIRLAFRERAMASHPDRPGENGDGETFRLAREAYEVLRDPQKRMAYDATAVADEPAEPRQRRSDAGQEERSPPRHAGTVRPAVTGWAVLERYLPLATAGLFVALVVALGALWSAQRQLGEQESVLAGLYARLARMGEEQADLRTRYRSLAFLDLERAGAPATGDTAANYLHEITFPTGGLDLEASETEALARALIEIAGLIQALPQTADWLIVLEVQAARAAIAGQVAVADWEQALLRLATVLDHLLAQGLPAERIAVRFNAGFAPSDADAGGGTLDHVAVKLVCCAEQP